MQWTFEEKNLIFKKRFLKCCYYTVFILSVLVMQVKLYLKMCIKLHYSLTECNWYVDVEFLSRKLLSDAPPFEIIAHLKMLS